jgi:hypothetical protein
MASMSFARRARVICVIRVPSQAPHIYYSLNINPPAPICPHATASHQNESIQVTGIPHHTEAPSGSPVFSIAAPILGTAHFAGVPALSVLLMQERRCTVGFGA